MNHEEQSDRQERIEISIACLADASERSETGELSGAELADIFGVSEPMISLIKKGRKVLSFEAVLRYAKYRGVELHVLMSDIRSKMVVAEETTQRPSDPPDHEIVSYVLENIQRKVALLRQPKKTSDCKAREFYEMAIGLAVQASERFNVPLLLPVICFSSNGGVFEFCVPDSSPMRRRKYRAKWSHSEPPYAFKRLVQQWWKKPALETNVSHDCTLTRPNNKAAKPVRLFWDDLWPGQVGARALQLRAISLPVFTNYATPNLGNAGDIAVSMVFLFPKQFVPPPSVRNSLFLIAQFVGQVHSYELAAQVQGLSSLIGQSLLPQDIRTHASYPVDSALHLKVEAFFERLNESVMSAERIGMVEIWSYDWTEGRFVSLSPSFRYVHPDIADEDVANPLDPTGPSMTTRQALDATVEERTPRPFAKSSLILAQRRPMHITSRDVLELNGIRINPRLEGGTVVGLPITLLDRRNRRSISSVLYANSLDRAMGPERLIERIMHVAQQEDLEDFIDISAAPSLAGAPSNRSRRLFDKRVPTKMSSRALPCLRC